MPNFTAKVAGRLRRSKGAPGAGAAGRKTNVLLVMHGSGRGGVEKSLTALCRQIDRERFRILVALPGAGPMQQALDRIGVETRIMQIESWTPFPFLPGERPGLAFLSTMSQRVAALVELIRSRQIDLVHSSTLSVLDGAVAARLAGRTHLWDINGKPSGSQEACGSYLSAPTVYGLVDELSGGIVAASRDVKTLLQRYLPNREVSLIHHGIDLAEFDAAAARATSVREEYGIAGRKLVTLVGRVAEGKGVDDFIWAASKVLELEPATAFLVVGPEQDAALAARLKALVRSMGLGASIIFTGSRSDIPSLLRDCNTFVCASRSAGVPYSMLEAMAAGRPVVTTRCGGPEEVVRDGVTGFQVSVGSGSEMAHRLLTLLRSAALRDAFGAEGRAVVRYDFSPQLQARRFERIYQRLSHCRQRPSFTRLGELILGVTSVIGARTEQLEREVAEMRGSGVQVSDSVIGRCMARLLGTTK
ncbi:MAG TPA: glycosyltransferase family 4 protein [Geomonas sp.]